MDDLVIQGIIFGTLEVIFIAFMMYKIFKARKEGKRKYK
jgi:hypothetical protein